MEDKLRRWRKIAHEAAQQSNRLDVPDISSPVSFHDYMASFKKGDLNLLLYEGEKNRGLKEVLKGIKVREDGVTTVILLIGPEGGLSPEEVEAAVECGFTTVSLGDLILRTETATIAALSILRYEFGV